MPEFLAQTEKLALFAFLVSSMLALGLTFTLPAIITPLRDGPLVLLALSLNFVIAPALAWLLTVVTPLDRGYANGLLLLGGAAGAPFLPKVVEAAGGDLPLAAALMGLLTVGTLLFLPFAVPFMMPGMQADPWGIARPLGLLIVLPLCLGMFVKSRVPAFAARAAPVLGKIGNATLCLFFILLVALNARALRGVVGSGVILVALVYFTSLFVIGWLVSGSSPEVRGVLGLATTGRNFGAALVPAASSFSDPKVTMMIVAGAIVCLVVSFMAAGWVRRQKSAFVG